MRLSIYPILLTVVLLGCGKKEKESAAEQPAQQTAPADSAAVTPASSYTFQTITAPESTFGYDVFKDGKLFIHQPHIPGMPGVKGFSKEEQAKKAAELMIEKMNQGIVPPTLSEEEISAIMKL